MGYQIGDTVVYPRHGAARIIAQEDHSIKGITKSYIKLEILSADDLIIEIPADNFEKVGIRDIVNTQAVSEVFEILRKPIEEEKINWSRRYKTNVEKIATGDVKNIAEVVRDLTQRDTDIHGLSAGEKRMLLKARTVLASEIALSENITEDEAQHLLDVNLGIVPPTDADLTHHSQAPEEPASQTLLRCEREKAQKKATKSK
ncbi:MAG: CarD family transcriptional regulator [Aeriscardovia sp.]|nr:CarD family transcriptional regulator [Aeriscardovia sp.]